jgi:hypothetical protein
VVAECADTGLFLDLVRGAFALSNVMNWRRVTSRLNNEDEDWNCNLKESEGKGKRRLSDS